MLWNSVLIALREIRRNVLRSSLTVLGVVIGVASVITMVTIGDGATANVQKDIAKLGSNLLHLRPGQDMRGFGGARSTATLFKLADAVAIQREVPSVAAVAPVSQKTSQVIFGNSNWSTTVTGTNGMYLTVRDWILESGRNFTEVELRSGSAVCLLGATVYKQLFNNQNPLGQKIRIQKISCQVIGVLSAKGQAGFGQDQDDIVVVPITMMQRRIQGDTDVAMIMISARDGAATETVQANIERLMRERRQLRDGVENDFRIMDMKEIANTLSSTTKIMTTLLGSVAAVSLLVGGVGIMNIMLVSVTERTREIGIRLAVGAMAADVLIQFLLEAVVLAVLGGIIGIILGLTAGILLTHFFAVPFVLNTGIIVLSFSFSLITGMVFGYFPARRAASMDPIQALRYE